MRKTILFIAAAVCLASCQKEQDASVTSAPGQGLAPICFSIGDESGVDYATKSVSETTSISTVYITAGNGASSFPSDGPISNAAFNLSAAAEPGSGAQGGTFASGKTYYWPSSSTSINFICTNKNKTVTRTASGGTMSVAPLTDGDVMCDCVTASSGTVAFQLNHIFYRLASIKLKCERSDMKATVSKITITPAKADATVTITSDGNAMAGGSTAGTAVTITPSPSLVVNGTTETAVTDTNVDMMLATPSATVKIDYTLEMPGYSETHSATATITTFSQGKKSKLTGTIKKPGSINSIDFTVSVVAWGEENLTADFQ